MVGNVQSWTNLETLENSRYTYYFIWFLVPSLIFISSHDWGFSTDYA
jgi:hypothetical protein